LPMVTWLLTKADKAMNKAWTISIFPHSFVARLIDNLSHLWFGLNSLGSISLF
jgi:hypothetical protein